MHNTITDNEELKRIFCGLVSGRELADLLGIEYSSLVYYAYKIANEKKYRHFQITKKSGAHRDIYAPIAGLKFIQNQLNSVLQRICTFKPCVTGFTQNKSIVDNANIHVRKRYILNIDLKDFFPSINFGRIYSILQVYPFNLRQPVAAVIAQLCCFNGSLPQGAPTSPVLSNIVCMKLDNKLVGLAKETRCDYSRYADDISFSTFLKTFPAQLAKIDSAGGVIVADEITRIIQSNGFTINPNKVHLRSKFKRLEVTGLVVNEKVNTRREYLRQLHAISHACKKYGLVKAAEEFFAKYDRKKRNPEKPKELFEKIIKGKLAFIGSVRTISDKTYLNLCKKISQAAPEIMIKHQPLKFEGSITVQTEGKTDPIHMKSALRYFHSQGEYSQLDIKFEDGDGDKNILNKLKAFKEATSELNKPIFFVFDRDNDNIIREIRDDAYNMHHEFCYSLLLPFPDFRNKSQKISIEHYYHDDDIKRMDSLGRRLYFAEEFNSQSGRHRTDPNINCSDGKRNRGDITIIDNDVFDANSRNIALTKTDFAKYISERTTPFDEVKFDGFRKLFDVIMSALLE